MMWPSTHKHFAQRILWATAVALVAFIALATCASPARADSRAQYRQWIEEMKQDPRGPFDSVKWFCKDGTVLPPAAYACQSHGGGHQHGHWSARTVELRANGYFIANVMAGLDAAKAAAGPKFTEAYRQLLIERYLMAVDDGWVMRRALFYRGAIQEEDERAGSHELLLELMSRPEWLTLHYPELRIGVRSLPHGADTASVQKVRQLSASLADRDLAFQRLRAKIHNAPDASDADRVREYAGSVVASARKAEFERLADEIDAVYRSAPLMDTLKAQAAGKSLIPSVASALHETATELEQDRSAAAVHATTGRLLAILRDELPRTQGVASRLQLLELGLQIEAEHLRAGADLARESGKLTRQQRARTLAAAIDAAYGTGALRKREHEALQPVFARLQQPSLPLHDYLEALRYLGRVPGWASQGLGFHFLPAMNTLTGIEPRAGLFIQDQLRSSPLLAYSRILDTLARDGDRLAGVKHKLLDEAMGAGFRALNPGLARGVLVTRPDMDRVGSFRSDGIYVLPETVADLPPVAAILTAGEGNPLSHVQLLARNLGIPNVAVSLSAIERLRAHDGQRVVLAVSPQGAAEILPDGPEWDSYFDTATGDVVITPDLEKLDLTVQEFISLDALRAEDSGRIVGPKAAKLGELRRAFPEMVAPGVAVPFGLFRKAVLDRPYDGTGKTVFEHMTAEFRRIEVMPHGEAQTAEYEQLRAAIYERIASADPGAVFRAALARNMRQVFGTVDGVGVFIRSDTNVEDLPGFTGAGLNLTLPNVVGLENIAKGLQEVWASPYTRRAFAWRSTHMEGPEHVYPAVLLLKTVPASMSGVMITSDIESGDRNILSVAVNEGVGGAVEGQAAESLRIDRRTGETQLLAMASAPTRHMPNLRGGVDELPASGRETLLGAAHVRQLIDVAGEIPRRFPPITDDEGRPAPADVEFAFVDDRLQLLQIRPFLESRKARGSSYLQALDRPVRERAATSVNLREVPVR
jgi:Pyruvate phosphate dikinase, AMP/ATP-binding domain